ncbi:hypothetical protein [Halogeometricum limi]|uniref:Uncharacterized protein n=1 Tax=Halogeometricum limi TaxID=555875 RepID=A0A1I6H5K3_9EURY|nr:hypothetical protein [Halogeometricum limi]SFR49718.1 hypothetical protein SAMN04488124_1799 [Halogeometricum limi]
MTDTDLSAAFEDARTTAERVQADVDGESLPDDGADELRESTERVATAVSEASLSELLSVAGFDDVPDDASPTDLPTVIRDADPEAIVRLRTLLQLADLGDAWDELDETERVARLDDAVADEAESGGFDQLKEYLGRLGGFGEDESAAESEGTEDGADETGDDVDETGDDVDETGDDAGDGDDELLELQDHLGRLRQFLEDDSASADADAAESDDGADDEPAADADDERPRQSTAGSGGRLSTVPGSRSDMGKSTRFSSIRGRK